MFSQCSHHNLLLMAIFHYITFTDSGTSFRTIEVARIEGTGHCETISNTRKYITRMDEGICISSYRVSTFEGTWTDEG